MKDHHSHRVSYIYYLLAHSGAHITYFGFVKDIYFFLNYCLISELIVAIWCYYSNSFQWIHLNIIANIVVRFYNESLPENIDQVRWKIKYFVQLRQRNRCQHTILKNVSKNWGIRLNEKQVILSQNIVHASQMKIKETSTRPSCGGPIPAQKSRVLVIQY